MIYGRLFLLGILHRLRQRNAGRLPWQHLRGSRGVMGEQEITDDAGEVDATLRLLQGDLPLLKPLM